MKETNLHQYFRQSKDPKLCEVLYKCAMNYINSNGYQIKEHQKKALLNHITGMVKRNIDAEQINIQDKTIFNEVSQDSIEISNKLMEKLEYISNDEIYLLSIHFETIRNNK